MIYLKRIWNLVAALFIWCVFLLITPLSLVIELLVIAPSIYILENENYIEENDPFPFRVMWWLGSKLIIDTNKK